MSNDSIDSFQFGKIIILDIDENSIEEKLEVIHSNVSTIEVLESDDTVEINDWRFEVAQQFHSLKKKKWWDFFSFFNICNDLIMIIKELIESVTVNKIFVSWLDIRDTFKEALSDISPGEYLVTNPPFVDIDRDIFSLLYWPKDLSRIRRKNVV